MDLPRPKRPVSAVSEKWVATVSWLEMRSSSKVASWLAT
jgi:hypothetical protein